MGGKEKYGFPVLDCDGHVTEPLAIWDEYLEPKYRDEAREHFSIQNTPEGVIWVVEEFEGPRAVQQYGGPRRLHPGRYVRTGAYRPGMTLQEIGRVDTHGMMWGPEHGFMNPGGFSSDARIQDLEVEGVDKAVIIPSFFAMVPGVHSAPLAAALCRAYNDWVYDYCASYPDRLYPVAMVPVQDLELAGKEFERAVGKGFRIAAARPSRHGCREDEQGGHRSRASSKGHGPERLPALRHTVGLTGRSWSRQVTLATVFTEGRNSQRMEQVDGELPSRLDG